MRSRPSRRTCTPRPPSVPLLQRRRVDAVALARRCGPILEHVAEMAAAPTAVHLHPLHAVARIPCRGDRAGLGRAREAGPAGAALEFVVRAEQLGAASRAEEAARLVVVPKRAAEGALGPLLAEDAVLLGRQLAAPLFVAFLDLVVHGAADTNPSAAGTADPYQPAMLSSNRWARSASSAGRGDSLVTRAWGSVPWTSAGMSDLPYPIERSPFGTFSRCMIATSRSERIFPASSGLARDTSAPRISAATRCRSGQASAVKRNTAGALRMTDMPCGTIGWSPGKPSGRKSRTIPETG